MEEMIYIAVGKDYNSDKRNLLFVLQRFPGPIGILHVHSPSKLRPIRKSSNNLLQFFLQGTRRCVSMIPGKENEFLLYLIVMDMTHMLCKQESILISW